MKISVSIFRHYSRNTLLSWIYNTIQYTAIKNKSKGQWRQSRYDVISCSSQYCSSSRPGALPEQNFWLRHWFRQMSISRQLHGKVSRYKLSTSLLLLLRTEVYLCLFMLFSSMFMSVVSVPNLSVFGDLHFDDFFGELFLLKIIFWFGHANFIFLSKNCKQFRLKFTLQNCTQIRVPITLLLRWYDVERDLTLPCSITIVS